MQRGGKHQNGRGIEHAIDERCDNVRARLGHSDAREVIFVGNFERCGDHSVGELSLRASEIADCRTAMTSTAYIAARNAPSFARQVRRKTP